MLSVIDDKPTRCPHCCRFGRIVISIASRILFRPPIEKPEVAGAELKGW